MFNPVLTKPVVFGLYRASALYTNNQGGSNQVAKCDLVYMGSRFYCKFTLVTKHLLYIQQNFGSIIKHLSASKLAESEPEPVLLNSWYQSPFLVSIVTSTSQSSSVKSMNDLSEFILLYLQFRSRLTQGTNEFVNLSLHWTGVLWNPTSANPSNCLEEVLVTDVSI